MEEKDNAQVQNEEVKVENAEENKTDSTNTGALEKKDEKQPKVKKSKEKKKSKQEDLSEYEGLSDDELYAKIQTQKLLKKKQNKKIATIVGMGFAFVLAVVIIILAAVPVSLKPRCMVDGFDSVALYPGNSNGVSYSEGEDEYNEFMKVYDKAFSQPYISAIFSGSLFSYNIEETSDLPSTVIGAGGSLIQNNTYYVRLRYSQEQVLTYQSGKVFESKFYSGKDDELWSGKYSGGKLYFTDVYFEVNQTSGIQETNVYIVAIYPDKVNDNDKIVTKEYIVKITVKANTYAIYDAWDDLVDLKNNNEDETM